MRVSDCCCARCSSSERSRNSQFGFHGPVWVRTLRDQALGGMQIQELGIIVRSPIVLSMDSVDAFRFVSFRRSMMVEDREYRKSAR